MKTRIPSNKTARCFLFLFCTTPICVCSVDTWNSTFRKHSWWACRTILWTGDPTQVRPVQSKDPTCYSISLAHAWCFKFKKIICVQEALWSLSRELKKKKAKKWIGKSLEFSFQKQIGHFCFCFQNKTIFCGSNATKIIFCDHSITWFLDQLLKLASNQLLSIE